MDRRRAPRTTELAPLEEEILSSSPEETLEFAKKIRRILRPGAILCLTGELGAGKTTFVKGIASCAGDLSEREVSSPTFSYLHIYPGEVPIYHFDLYRLKSAEEFSALGFDEYLNAGGICCIEWAERIESLLPKHALFLSFTHVEEEKRKIARFHWA